MMQLFIFEEESDTFYFYNFCSSLAADGAVFTGSAGEEEGGAEKGGHCSVDFGHCNFEQHEEDPSGNCILLLGTRILVLHSSDLLV